MPASTILEKIDSPADLRALPESALPKVASELRQFIIQSVAKTGGHLASGLGVVELTIALHYVYNTPDDPLIWDVGHQCYPHKILTGRREQMQTIRKQHGLAGFPKRDESPFDAFGVGHSSTSISAALGMAIAARQLHRTIRPVAIIGDGAMTAGMAFEALNHAGDLKDDLLVILNDNEMSISPNVGGLSNRMAKMLSNPLLSSMREEGKRLLSHIPPMEEFARRAEEHVKGMVTPGTLFEELGLNYFGPINGHDVELLVSTLRNLRSMKGPILLHVLTRKGKGYAQAEQEPVRYHGVSAFDHQHGLNPPAAGSSPTYTEVFSDWLCEQAAADDQLVGITPAMREGSGLVAFSEQFPERYFDVAIAEQHALTLAAGMACEGLKPVVAIYSTFLQRAYDQLIHDIALQKLPVLLAIDRAGVVGPDGPTHQGAYDIAFMRCIPGLVLMTPADENECHRMLTTGFQHHGPAAVRYPRGRGPGTEVTDHLSPIPIGQAVTVRQGADLAILAFGPPLAVALDVAEAFDATVVNMRFVKPLDEALLRELAATHIHLVTIEDGCIAGGAGSAVGEWLQAEALSLPLLQLGLPDRFQEHGSRDELLQDAQLDAASIKSRISAWISDGNCIQPDRQIASR
ncbi:MAG: 1-deoxy-D-xylulose-5-phosphate synthase [Thiotrichales bacterium]